MLFPVSLEAAGCVFRFGTQDSCSQGSGVASLISKECICTSSRQSTIQKLAIHVLDSEFDGDAI